MNEAEQEAKFDLEDRDKCVQDVLAHLYEWHLLLINFIQKNLNGERTAFLPQPYNWKTYPQMNVQIWRNHQRYAALRGKSTAGANTRKSGVAYGIF